MPTRREFIKRAAGAATVGLIIPRSLLQARPYSTAAATNRRILVVLQFIGGNDGLNTVIPYTDDQYHRLRPTLGFKEGDLKDDQGRSTIISDRFGLHPSLTKIKDLYDQGRVAIVQGVGYPNPSDSHFTSSDIWHTGNPGLPTGNGWLGRYADLALADQTGLQIVAETFAIPRSLSADKAIAVSFSSSTLTSYAFQTDAQYPAGRESQVGLFSANNSSMFPAGSLLDTISRDGIDALRSADDIARAIDGYSSTVAYPSGNSLADAFKVVVEIVSGVPEANLLYLLLSDFDTHAQQADRHRSLLSEFGDAVKAFYDDLSVHGLADNVVMMQWSEFGRRPEENGSVGTDHGAASSIFVIGNPVTGGLYGDEPSLAPGDLDPVGNPRFTLDFRSVYATVLDRWLNFDSRLVLGGEFPALDFLA